MESVAFIEWCLEHLNYWTITLLMTIESSFIPFPSEVVVPPAAWLAADPASGMNVYLVVVFATLGAMLGAVINYYLAMWLGRPIIYKFANSRFGHMCLIDEPAVKKAEAAFGAARKQAENASKEAGRQSGVVSAAAQVRCVEKVQMNPIYDVKPEKIHEKVEGAHFLYVEGLDDLLKKCYEEEKIMSDYPEFKEMVN